MHKILQIALNSYDELRWFFFIVERRSTKFDTVIIPKITRTLTVHTRRIEIYYMFHSIWVDQYMTFQKPSNRVGEHC